MKLSQVQQDQIRAFVANGPMKDAVLAVLLDEEQGADSFGEIDRAIDDAEYGRKVKVWAETRALVRSRFEELARIASSNPQAVPENQAR
jgi:hypothetical protein